MLPNNIVSPEKFPPSAFNTNIITLNQKDELLILINKLSGLLKNFTKSIKNIISKKNIEISFIDNNIDYAYTIVNNIVKHNYSYEQLKSLKESLVKIKEKNSVNKLDLLEEEQNLILFFEQSECLLKAIINKQKQKSGQFNDKNKSKSPNSTFNNSLPPFRNRNINKNLEESHSSLAKNNKNKRTRSAGNKDNKFADENSKDIKMRKNKNSIIFNPPISSTESSYNMLTSNYNSLCNNINNNISTINNIHNSNIRKISQSMLVQDNNALYQKYELLKKQNFIFQKKIENLNQELLNYKNSSYFSKNKINKEISTKIKHINLLTQENETLKRKLQSFNKSPNSRAAIQNNMFGNISENLDIYDRETNNNTSYSFIFQENGNNIPTKLIQKENEIKFLKQEKMKMEKFIKEQNIFINKGKIIEKEYNILKAKLSKSNIEFNEKRKKLEIEIHRLNEKLVIEINRNEELNSLYQDQKIKYEYEISDINDKRAELSRLLANKNSEIIKLQKELVVKNKEFEEYKLLVKNNAENSVNFGKMKGYYDNLILEKNKKELELNNRINLMKSENNTLYLQNEKRKNDIIELNKSITRYEEELSKKNEEINKMKIINKKSINNNFLQYENYEKETELNKLKKENEQLINAQKNINNSLKEEIKKLKDENEGLKEFSLKVKEKEEKLFEKYQTQKDKISILQKENEVYKKYFMDKKLPIPFQDFNRKKSKIEDNETNINMIEELNKAKKEINDLKKKNEELFNELESKKFSNQFCDNFSEGKVISNYEEEFDLKKMAKGAKDKNRSQDINIDYPGAQEVKEKYRELDFYYNSLEELVKKLLLNCTCTNKNKAYISELCKIVGFEEDVTNKIINNKSKKGINLFG